MNNEFVKLSIWKSFKSEKHRTAFTNIFKLSPIVSIPCSLVDKIKSQLFTVGSIEFDVSRYFMNQTGGKLSPGLQVWTISSCEELKLGKFTV